MALKDSLSRNPIIPAWALLLMVLALSLSSCYQSAGHSSTQGVPSLNNSGLVVVASTFPLYDFARNVGGDFVSVGQLLPPGVSPHAYDPKPSDIRLISSSDIFILTSRHLEVNVWKIISSVKEDNPDLSILEVSSVVGHLSKKQGGGEFPFDPHIWLDFRNDIDIVNALAQLFSEKDPAHAAYYRERAREYAAELSSLDSLYNQSLSNCSLDTFVIGGHAAFSYLAARYGLSQVAVEGLSPNARPSPRVVQDIISLMRKKGVKYVFFDKFASPEVAEVLADETGARAMVLDAGVNRNPEQIKRDVSFIDIMKFDLENLRTALECG